jgi:outer membrane protein TolC
MQISQLLATAMRTRPELKFLEERRNAARAAIRVAAASLAPEVSVFGNISGSGATLSHSYENFPSGYAAVATSGTPTPANVLGGIQLPLPDVISGAHLVTPGPQNVLPAAIVKTPPQQVGTRIRGLFTAGFQANWTVAGMGVVDAAETAAAKAEAREALLRYNDELTKVSEQVRTAYLNSLSAETQIEETTAEVESSLEELQFAQERLAAGVGTNVDVITAQRDYTNALVDKARAIIEYDVSQIQLLHAIGTISVGTICSGLSPDALRAPR